MLQPKFFSICIFYMSEDNSILKSPKTSRTYILYIIMFYCLTTFLITLFPFSSNTCKNIDLQLIDWFEIRTVLLFTTWVDIHLPSAWTKTYCEMGLSKLSSVQEKMVGDTINAWNSGLAVELIKSDPSIFIDSIVCNIYSIRVDTCIVIITVKIRIKSITVYINNQTMPSQSSSISLLGISVTPGLMEAILSLQSTSEWIHHRQSLWLKRCRHNLRQCHCVWQFRWQPVYSGYIVIAIDIRIVTVAINIYDECYTIAVFINIIIGYFSSTLDWSLSLSSSQSTLAA